MKRYRNYFSYVLCCALLASGCGSRKSSSNSSSGSSSSASQADKIGRASELVTEADARRILGGPVQKTTDQTSAQENVCIYLRANQDQVTQLYVTLNLSPTEEAAKHAYETRTKSQDGKPIAGIGDEAKMMVRSSSDMALFVLKKRIIFTLFVHGDESLTSSPDDLQSLARRVADQL
jgi:hypothetical protein